MAIARIIWVDPPDPVSPPRRYPFAQLASGSSLALAPQSAAWANTSLALASSLPLGAESASWTNPAIGILSSITLGAESAAWTNPALALSNALTLGLAEQSAAWSNPGLTFSQSLGLAAESAAWTNPGLSLAESLPLGSQSAAWTNLALLPNSSGGGVVIELAPQSALFTVASLGLFLCPKIVNPFLGTESCVISNTEVVTLYRKTADGAFDGGTLIGQALRLDAMKDGLVSSGAAKRKKELDWYLWKSQTGSPEVKDGDYILDSWGNKWVIWTTDVQAWGNRFLIKTKLAQ